MVHDLRPKAIRFLLGGILAFVALNAVAGGFYGISGAEGVPLEWLEGSPFSNYFIPSLVLMVVVGATFLFASIAVFTDAQTARASALGAGGVLLIWLVVQVAIIGFVSWMQPSMAICALVVLVLSWFLPRPDISNA